MSILYRFAFTMQPSASTETIVVMKQGDQPILPETRKGRKRTSLQPDMRQGNGSSSIEK